MKKTPVKAKADKRLEITERITSVKAPTSHDQVMADLSLSPALNAGIVVHAFSGNTLGHDAAGITELVEALQDSSKRVNDGDMSQLESMLVTQAMALQTIFTSYAKRAQHQQLQAQLEAFMGMALKAQTQSRATIQALVELKFPRQATFVKQANIAHGPQQVNNAPAPVEALTHAEQTAVVPNKLLERRGADVPCRFPASEIHSPLKKGP